MDGQQDQGQQPESPQYEPPRQGQYPQQQDQPFGGAPGGPHEQAGPSGWQGPQPDPAKTARRRYIRSLIAGGVGVIVAVAVFLVVRGTGDSGSPGTAGSSCLNRAATWWRDGGGKGHFNAVDNGTRSVESRVVSMATLTTGSSADAGTDAAGAALAAAASKLESAAQAALRDPPPACDSRLVHDMAASYAQEGDAAAAYEAAGQDIAKADITSGVQLGQKAGTEQDKANTDDALVTADLKSLIGK